MINTIVTGAAYIGLVYLLGQILKDFVIHQKEKTWIVGLALLLVDVILFKVFKLVGWLLSVVPNLVTFGFFSEVLALIVGILASMAVLWVTDKFSKTLEIRNIQTLAISGVLLSISRWVIGKIV